MGSRVRAILSVVSCSSAGRLRLPWRTKLNCPATRYGIPHVEHFSDFVRIGVFAEEFDVAVGEEDIFTFSK